MGRYDDRLPRPLCRVKNHAPAGTMSNLGPGEPLVKGRAHASTVVCARAECQADAEEWVYAATREDGIFATFEQNRVPVGVAVPPTTGETPC